MLLSIFKHVFSFFGKNSSNKETDATLLPHEVAGQYAEDEVDIVLRQLAASIPSSVIIRNALFVFGKNTPHEFSVETDHLLITSKNIYLIETKYKSGVIYAPPSKPLWKVQKKNGYTPIRNSLKQVQASAGALQRRLPLPATLIPLVVIVGAKVKLHGNSDSVLRATELKATIIKIESQTPSSIGTSPNQIQKSLLSFISKDPEDLRKHRERVAEIKSRKSTALGKHLHLDRPFFVH